MIALVLLPVIVGLLVLAFLDFIGYDACPNCKRELEPGKRRFCRWCKWEEGK